MVGVATVPTFPPPPPEPPKKRPLATAFPEFGVMLIFTWPPISQVK
jgi:hypothetical protein